MTARRIATARRRFVLNAGIDKKRGVIYNRFMKKKARTALIVTGSVFAALAVAVVVMFSVLAALSAKMPEDFVYEKSVRFIAHRGLSSKFYENGERAFLAAAESGFFYGIETDLYFTADGVAVCAHDDNAFSDGSVRITESEYERIKDLPLKENAYGLVSDGICLFERYLKICADFGKVAVVELKQPDLNADEIAEAVNMAKKYCGDKFVMISFSAKHVKTVEKIDPDLVTQRLQSNAFTGWFAAAGGYNISLNESAVSAFTVNAAHRRGREIGVWTVNSIDEVKRFTAMGVDYITTDFDFSA